MLSSRFVAHALCCYLLLASAVDASGGDGYDAQPWKATSFGAQTSLSARNPSPPPLTTFANLTVEAIFLTATTMRLRIVPSELRPGQSTPFVVPDIVVSGNTAPATATVAADNITYQVGLVADSNASNNSVAVLDSEGNLLIALHDLVFDQQLIQFRTNYSVQPGEEEYLYGYGEHNYRYFINPDDTSDDKNVTLSLWNTDNGTPWRKPMYGVHPVLFHSFPSQSARRRPFAVFWANSHAQSLNLFNGAMTYTALGGIVDLYVILDTTPLGVVRQYHALIGPSAVPPYWSLGTHQCRWGYQNLSVVEAVVAGYEAAAIPLETMWNDIDYMQEFRVFTTDPVRYPADALANFAKSLHQKNMHYVQITDPGVAQVLNYSVYTSGIEQGVFVKTTSPLDGAPTNQSLVNAVWPGWTVFPDFTSSAARLWWGEQIQAYRGVIPVDGMWLDMNELGTFCAGQCDVAVGTPWSADWKTIDWNTFTTAICMPNNCTVVDSPLNYPPLNPLDNGYSLFNKTLDMTGSLSLGSYYETKTFYGMMEEKASYDALLAQTGTRPFLLSRASYAGSGRFTAHWTGDNSASWAPKTGGIYDSIQAILGSNLWGIPMVGADIGGFSGTTTEELIVRWYQLGAFYPFTRNHHDLQGPGQEPYLFSLQAQAAIIAAIEGKYRLLPYYFTYLMLANQNAGPVLRHLSLQFPTDLNTYVESPQFMVGDAILVNPVVEQGATGQTLYLPLGVWYHLWSGKVVCTICGTDILVAIFSVYDPLVTLARGGYIIPVHQEPQMTVTATQASGIGLRVYMDGNETAMGGAQLATDGPLDEQTVVSMTYVAVGNLHRGSLTSTGNGPTFNPNRTSSSRVVVYLFFPTLSDLPVNFTSNFTVDGVVDETPEVNISAYSIAYRLPVGKDGSTRFSLDWYISTIPFPPPPPPTDTKTAAIAGAAAGGGVCAAAVIVGAVWWWRRRHGGSESEYHQLNEQEKL